MLGDGVVVDRATPDPKRCYDAANTLAWSSDVFLGVGGQSLQARREGRWSERSPLASGPTSAGQVAVMAVSGVGELHTPR